MVFPPPAQTRLVTIIAHVDHGKTTLADNLIESNGIISERLAGTLRYLDSMEEEQRRGITMRASAIGLRHAYKNTKGKQAAAQQQQEEIVIHLLDSPGHTDFAPEVSSSLQLCDGAMLVVDAVEGMCARTHQVLREAHSHQLVPLLVINKLDRLCTDLCLTPTEAYVRIRNLIESVNAASAAMLLSKKHDDDDDDDDDVDKGDNNNTAKKDVQQQQNDNIDEEEMMWTFEPSKGNVVFGSALYGWGFTCPSLARSLFRSKVIPTIKPPVLKQCLFADCKYQNGKVLKWKQSSSDEPMFAEYALRPLWEIYEGVATAATSVGMISELFADGRAAGTAATHNNNNKKKKEEKIKSETPGMDQVLASMMIGATSEECPQSLQDIQFILHKTGSSSGEETALRSLLRRYRPLSDTILDAVVEVFPDPSKAATTVRTHSLALQMPPPTTTTTTTLFSEHFTKIQKAVSSCDIGVNVPTVAHIFKFMSTDRANVRDPDLPSINEGGDDGGTSSSKNLILGLARVLSGTLRTNDVEYYLFGPKYKPQLEQDDDNTNSETPLPTPPHRTIRLYLLMGSSFVRVNEVPAGHICAVYDLEDVQLKTVTLCDDPYCMPLQSVNYGIRPLVKVNVEPVSASDTDALERGLVKLSLADAAVEVTATAKGERILACLGELHLEQSILDLETVYCNGASGDTQEKMKLRISDPIVEFGETTQWFDDTEFTDYEGFWDTSQSSSPLRQVRIPPYCDEEGIEYALGGRTRTILSGRGAAIGLRVLPLAECVYASLKAKRIVDESSTMMEDELLKIGNALKCGAYDSKGVFSCLLNALCGFDGNGNVLVESMGIQKGSYVMGIVSDAGQVHVPSTAPTSTESKDKFDNDDNHGECASMNSGEEEYTILQKRLQSSGFVGLPVMHDIGEDGGNDGSTLSTTPNGTALNIWKNEMRGSAVAGFQLAMRYGPLCEEPVRAVMVILESVEIALQQQHQRQAKQSHHDDDTSAKQQKETIYSSAKPLSGGMVVAALRSGIRCASLTRPARLMEGHLRLTLHSSMTGLGSLYTVLSKRRGKVLTDDMVEGTDLLLITATIPQAESFRLTTELLRQSSGEVTAPELIFDHWEVLEEDPFWIPTTLEEREDFGENLMNGDLSTGIDNNALKYIRLVRERKGLLVDSSRTVIAAEKQRTLKR